MGIEDESRRAPRASQACTASELDTHHAHITCEPDAHITCEPDAHRGRAKHAPCVHREDTWAMEWCKRIFWKFKLFCIYLNISLCLLRHIDVSSDILMSPPETMKTARIAL